MTLCIRQLLNNHNLSQLVLEPTHKSGHIIDWLIACESDNLISSVSVTDQLESDHKAAIACLNLSKPLRNLRFVIRRQLKNINKNQFGSDAAHVSPSYHLPLIQHRITTPLSAIS